MSQFPTQPTQNAPIQQQQGTIPRPRSPEPMTEVLEAMRSEFLSVTNEINNLKSTKEELETKISIQKSEIDNFKNQAKVLEGCFLNMRKRYEQEINQLRKELETGGGSGDSLNRKIPQNSSLNSSNNVNNNGIAANNKPNNGSNNGAPQPPSINNNINNRSSAQPPSHNNEHTPAPVPSQIPPVAAPISPVNTDPHHQDWKFIPHRNLEKFQFDLISSLSLPSVVCCVQFNPTGNLLAIGLNQSIQIFQIKAGPDGSFQVNRLLTLIDEPISGRVQYVRSLAFSPDSKQLASGGEDFIVTLWDLRDLPSAPLKESEPSPIQSPIKLNGHEGDIYTLSFHPTQPLLISGSGDCTCRVWDLSRNNECKFIFRTDSPSPQQTPKDPSITCLKIFNNKLATGSLDGKLRVWDLNSGKMLELFEAHNDGIYGVGWINQGRGLLSASLDNTLKQWNLHSGSNVQHSDLNGLNSSSSTQCVATFKGHEDFVLCFDINKEEKLIVSGGKDQSLCLWNLDRRELIGRLYGHRNSVISVSFHPSKNIIVSGSGDSTCKLWIFKPLP